MSMTRRSLARNWFGQEVIQDGRQKITAWPANSGRKMARLSQVLPLPDPLSTQPHPELSWNCEVCGDIAPVELPSGRWIRRSCECERNARSEYEKTVRFEVWKREVLSYTFGGWLGPQWADKDFIHEMATKTFDSYDVSHGPQAFLSAYDFAQKPEGNLLFCSKEFGVGKTHLEAAICNSLREIGYQSAQGKIQHMSSVFVSAPLFFSRYYETKKAIDQAAHNRLIKKVLTSPLLVIDDIDKRTIQRTDGDIYWMIFNARHAAERPTILSTNRQAELEHLIGSAAFSRFSSSLTTVELKGGDYRREGPEENDLCSDEQDDE